MSFIIFTKLNGNLDFSNDKDVISEKQNNKRIIQKEGENIRTFKNLKKEKEYLREIRRG